MTQTTVTYTLEEVLKRIEDKIDDLKEDIKEIKEDIGKLKTDVAIISEKLDGIDKRVSKLEATQATQLWALIVLLIGAFVKFGFFPNP